MQCLRHHQLRNGRWRKSQHPQPPPLVKLLMLLAKKDWDVKSPHRVLWEIRLIGLLPYRGRHHRTLLRRRRRAPRQWRLRGCNQWLFRRTPLWRLAQRERPLIRCRLDRKEHPMSPLPHPPLLLQHRWQVPIPEPQRRLLLINCLHT